MYSFSTAGQSQQNITPKTLHDDFPFYFFTVTDFPSLQLNVTITSRQHPHNHSDILKLVKAWMLENMCVVVLCFKIDFYRVWCFYNKDGPHNWMNMKGLIQEWEENPLNYYFLVFKMWTNQVFFFFFPNSNFKIQLQNINPSLRLTPHKFLESPFLEIHPAL